MKSLRQNLRFRVLSTATKSHPRAGIAVGLMLSLAGFGMTSDLLGQATPPKDSNPTDARQNVSLTTETVAVTQADQTGDARSQSDAEELGFRDLFNGKDLTGWVDVNTSDETWSVRDGMLICSGQPIGVMRSQRQYENFILEVEWRHMEAGGNSGIFLWCDAIPQANTRLPKGMEVQMLELDWVNQHARPDGTLPPIAYVQGELFGAGGMTASPENPRGTRSKSVEHRCKGKGEWNKYVVVAVDGNVKLSINGKFVNGIRDASVKKGYLCLESEGKEIHFRNLRIMELPPGLADESNTAPEIK